MTKKGLAAMVLLLAAIGLARAQTPSFAVPVATDDGLMTTAPTVRFDSAAATPTERVWFSAEFLVWWLRDGPTGGPLIASGSQADPVPGALDQPGTVPFQNSSLHFGNTSGLRFSGGFVITDMLAIEASYFVLEQRSNGYSAFATADGTDLIARPVTNAMTGTEAAYVTASPGFLTGGSAVAGQTRLQGYDLNLSANLFRGPALAFDVLAGFRSLYLNETLTISDSLVPAAPGVLTFNGAPVDAFTPVSVFDRFRTQNTFYGGQLGGRVTWQEDRLSVSVVGGIALGTTQQLAFVSGATVLNAPGAAPVVAPGGILAQPSNIGRWYNSTFSVVPEAGVDIAYQITPRLRATVGYTFLYWNHVARPGNQIDRTVNPSQVPIDPTFGTGGAARPAPPSFAQSDFWAQGLSFGIAFSY